MTWRARTRSEIQLTSPDGDEFTAKWIGGERVIEKTLGLFKYPRVKGTVTQDLEIGATRYPLTIFFDGADNDLFSQSFFEASKQNGLWSIIHPIYGDLTLQLSTCRESAQPVTSGNVTEITCEFIEPASDAVTVSAPELASRIGFFVAGIAAQAAEDFEDKTPAEIARQVVQIEKVASATVSAARLFLSVLYTQDSTINGQVEAIIRSLDATVSADPLDVGALAGQLQNLVTIPFLASGDVLARLKAYQNFSNEVFTIENEGIIPATISGLMTKEIILTSVLNAAARSASTGLLQTRQQAIDAVDLLIEIFNSIVDHMDGFQEEFLNNPIDIQYVSFLNTFPNSTLITAQAVTFLLKASLDLAVEKILVLQKPRAPIEITITEYGTLGLNDENLDLFIDSNNLKGRDIRILPAGREVVIYA